jgi:hypothetical protein
VAAKHETDLSSVSSAKVKICRAIIPLYHTSSWCGT